MDVSLQHMSVDAGIVIPVFVEQCGYFVDGVRQVLDMEGDVFDHAGRAQFSHAADCRENP